MAGFNQDLLSGAAGGPFLRDYTHASKTFRTNSYQYAPKLKFLFHVYFDINTQAYSQNTGTGANFGLAVKTIKLPSFSFATQEFNQYNRKRIIQTKIKYDPIDVAFHDDNGTSNGPFAGGIIRNLWKAYYKYYYNDGKKPAVSFTGSSAGAATTGTVANYNERNQYADSITGNADWGYIGESSAASGVKIPFFKNITVFGFNQHSFVAYTLINPMITRFAHDTYSYAEGNGTMEMQMGIDYETVVYNEGSMSGNSPGAIVTGFGDSATYDRDLSPIAPPGTNGMIVGAGGLISAGTSGSVVNQANTTGTVAGVAYNTTANPNLTPVVNQVLAAGLQTSEIINSTRNALFDIPGPVGSTPSISGTAGVPTTGALYAPQTIGEDSNAGVQNT